MKPLYEGKLGFTATDTVDGSKWVHDGADWVPYVVPTAAVLKSAETLTGFDREQTNQDASQKNMGIMQYCHLASSGEIHNIGSDRTGAYTLLTGQTTFADGTALADRTIMQYHDAGETDFSYWLRGKLVTVTTAKFLQLAADFAGYIYYDEDGEIEVGETAADELIVRSALIAYIYNNPTTGELVWLADERHGIVMDGQTHLQQHTQVGFNVVAGLDISGIANNTSTFTSVSAGAGGDEDIKMVFSEITTAPKIFKESGYWRITDDDNKLGVFRTAKCSYNDVSTPGSEVLAEINNDYVIMMPMATNNKLNPIVILVGQTLHLNRGAARQNMPAEYFRTKANGLPSHEFHPLASMIIHNESTGQIEKGADSEIYTSCVHGFPMGIFE